MTQSNDDALDTALERLLAGEATPAERALVEQQAAANPDFARKLAALSAEFSASGERWSTKSRRSFPRLATTRKILLRVAAAILVVLSASSVWRFVRIHTSHTMRVIATPKGQRATFVLADGTRVMLDVDSKLRVDVSGHDGSRDVYLAGEGFFQVKHDATRPFNVHAAGAITRVLGTEFDVRAYPEGRDVIVAVRSGAVSLKSGDPSMQGVLLTRGQVGSIDSLGNAKVQTGASAETLLGWTTGNLVLSDVTMRAAAEQLARWYNVRIVVQDGNLAARRVNALFRDEPVTQAVGALSVALGARVKRVGDTFYISPGGGR